MRGALLRSASESRVARRNADCDFLYSLLRQLTGHSLPLPRFASWTRLDTNVEVLSLGDDFKEDCYVKVSLSNVSKRNLPLKWDLTVVIEKE